jgi:hypothetical protein
MARARTVVWWAVGLLSLLAVLVLSAGLWWARSLYQSERTAPARAAAAFAEVRARFAGVPPALEIRGKRLVVVRTATASSGPRPTAIRILVWTAGDQTLSRGRLPLAISIVATEPLPIEALIGVANDGLGTLAHAKRRGDELNIRLRDLERYGHTLLLDGTTPDGRHVLMWTD